MPGHETLMTAFQAAQLAARRFVVPVAPAMQHVATLETLRSKDFQQKPTSTEIGSSLALRAES